MRDGNTSFAESRASSITSLSRSSFSKTIAPVVARGAQKMGLRILIESHSTRSEAAGDDLDGATLAKMFRAQARAVEILERDPTPYVHYFIAETGGLLEPHELQTWRLLHAPPQPYTRERFDDTYNWTVKWNMTVPGATYENTVDNRAWQ